MKAIDFRFRPNTPDAVDGLIHSPFFGDMCAFFNYPDRAWSASLDKIVEIMDEHEITGVITGRDVETTYGCPCSNMGVVEMMRAYPHKFYGMAGLDPHKGMQAIDELSRMVNEFGMKGASVDPYLAKLPADHRKFYPIYAKCCEFDIPVVISTGMATLVDGADPEHCHPRSYRRGGPGLPQTQDRSEPRLLPVGERDHHGRSAQPQRVSGAFRV